MLGSITPLGERGRNQRWAVTLAWFAAGSLAGGAGTGALFGAAGANLLAPWPGSVPERAMALGLLLAVGAVLDAGIGGARLPAWRRQVNEDWLGRYRGWVYGGAFGLQLGTGLSTVVSTSAVYLTFLAAFLAGGPGAGVLVGGVFGLLRAAPSLAATRARTPGDVARLGGLLRRWEPAARRTAIALLAVLAVGALGMAAT